MATSNRRVKTTTSNNKPNNQDYQKRYISGINEEKAKSFNLYVKRYIKVKETNTDGEISYKYHFISFGIINKTRLSDAYIGNDIDKLEQSKINQERETKVISEMANNNILNSIYTIQMEIEKKAVESFNLEIEEKAEQIKINNRKKLLDLLGDKEFRKLKTDEQIKNKINELIPITQYEKEIYFFINNKIGVMFSGYLSSKIDSLEEAKKIKIADTLETAKNLRG